MTRRFAVVGAALILLAVLAVVLWRIESGSSNPHSPQVLNQPTEQRRIHPFKPGAQPDDPPANFIGKTTDDVDFGC